MKHNEQIHLWILLILIAGAITVFVSTVSAQDMHVLMVIDDANAMSGRGHELDEHRIEALMQDYVKPMLKAEDPGAKVNIEALRASDNTLIMENIFDWFRNLNPGPNDVVFVYFSGPGGVDERKPPHERFLSVSTQILYRKELAKAVEELNCRLKILITETANGRISQALPPYHYFRSEKHLKQLFLEHRGFLNLTSARLGFIALGDDVHGGYFTRVLIDRMMSQSIKDVDLDGNDFLSWEEVFEGTKKDLDILYQKNAHTFPRLRRRLQERGQETLIPAALSDFPKRWR